MQCVDFARRLNLVLDERQRPDDDDMLQAHASDCSDCQQLLLGQSRLMELLGREVASLPSDFSRRTVAAASVPSRVSARTTRILAAVLATAATLLIVASPVARRLSRGPISLEQRPSVPTIRTKGDHSRRRAIPTIAALQPELRKIDRKVPAAPAVVRSEPEEFRRLIRDFWRNLPEVPDSQLEPIDRLAGGFRPLASTLGAALDALRRSLPVGRDQVLTEPQAQFLESNSQIRLT